jgi:hypothetical protein
MSNSTKPCQDYERRWRHFCVDKNLKDGWLERLNDLKGFNLVSICEGHYQQRKYPSGKYPHINLKLKEQYLPGFAKGWEQLRPAVLNEVHKLFQKGDTYFNLELKHKLRAGIGRLVYQEDLTVKMRRYQARLTEEMDPESAAWFDQCVGSIECLDEIVVGWFEAKER